MNLPISWRDWLCRAPGREDHRKVLWTHPLSGLRLLRCLECDADEIRSWLASSGNVPDPLTQASCCEKVLVNGYLQPAQQEAGASLLELIVVVGIILTVIGIGIPILLSAVQAVRDWAAVLNQLVIH